MSYHKSNKLFQKCSHPQLQFTPRSIGKHCNNLFYVKHKVAFQENQIYEKSGRFYYQMIEKD